MGGSSTHFSLFLLVVDHPSSDIIECLTKKKSKKHREVLKLLGAELSQLSQVQYVVIIQHLYTLWCHYYM